MTKRIWRWGVYFMRWVRDPTRPTERERWVGVAALFILIVAGVLVATWPALDGTPLKREDISARKDARNLASGSGAQGHQTKKGPIEDAQIFTWLVHRFLEFKLTDWLLVIFTGILAVKTAGLFRETEGLRQAADRQARDLVRSITAAEAQAKTANASFISTHRPRILVRDVYCTSTGSYGSPIEVRFTVVNGGDSTAHIEDNATIVELFSTLSLMLVPVAEGGNDLRLVGERAELRAGESKTFVHIATVVKWSSDAEREWGDERLGLFFSGHIVYTDDNGTKRHTAFRRRYDPGRKRFYAMEDGEHEYAD